MSHAGVVVIIDLGNVSANLYFVSLLWLTLAADTVFMAVFSWCFVRDTEHFRLEFKLWINVYEVKNRKKERKKRQQSVAFYWKLFPWWRVTYAALCAIRSSPSDWLHRTKLRPRRGFKQWADFLPYRAVRVHRLSSSSVSNQHRANGGGAASTLQSAAVTPRHIQWRPTKTFHSIQQTEQREHERATVGTMWLFKKMCFWREAPHFIGIGWSR